MIRVRRDLYVDDDYSDNSTPTTATMNVSEKASMSVRKVPKTDIQSSGQPSSSKSIHHKQNMGKNINDSILRKFVIKMHYLKVSKKIRFLIERKPVNFMNL